MKTKILIICCFLLIQSAYAQSSKGKTGTTKATTATKPATQQPASKPAATTTQAPKPNATPPPPEQSETNLEKGGLTKYELYSQIRSYLETNGLKNWILAERLSHFIIAYKEPVAVVPEKSGTVYESEQKELDDLAKVYLPKPYEIAIEFTPYTKEQYNTTIQKDENADKKLEELKAKYKITDIFENVETKEYYAGDNDERNRLANFILSKSIIEGNKTEVSNSSILYVQNFSVELKYPQSYYTTIPKQAGVESERIIQFLKNTILSHR